MFPLQKHIFFIYCVLGFAVPGQDSSQGTAAVPKCIHFSPDGANVFWHSQACTCRRPGGVWSRKPPNCAKTKFPAEEKGGVMVDTSVLCCQLLVVTSWASDLLPDQVRTSVARAFRIELLKAVYKAKLCLLWVMTDCFFVVYSNWNQWLNLKFLKSSWYFHMWHPKAESATSINCGGLSVFLDKLDELTVEQDPSTLSHKCHLSKLTRVIHLKDMKVLFKSHVYQVFLGIFW